jgi:hypothetical protein
MKFTSNITRDSNSNWKCVVWNDSVKELGTGKAVKVKAVINGHEFLATFLPVGGMHMLPLRANVLKSIKKDVGDSVDVEIEVTE